MNRPVHRKKTSHATPGSVGPQVIRVGPKGVITIPEENRRAMALEPGNYLTAVQVGRSLVLSPEINDFLALAERFQAKLSAAGGTPEGLLAELDDARRELFGELFGGADPVSGRRT